MSPGKRKFKKGTNSGKTRSIIHHTSSAVDDALSTQPDDPTERRYFRRSLLIIGCAFLVMLFFFFAAFFLAVRGAERTVVPQVVNTQLTEALVMLQERELYPRLQVKYTGNPSDKGEVIDQDPEAGLYVKAGRRVTITVSRGAIVDNVEDYVGRTLDEVRGRLATLFSTFEPLLVVREPVTYVYDESPAGTILSQTPTAGTPLAEPVDLVLIVSRGAIDRPVRLPDWSDWNTDSAIRSLAGIPLAFRFVEDNVEAVGTVPRVSSQSPPPQTEVEPDRTITLGYTPPASYPAESRYGLFEYMLPNFPVPVLLKAIVREPGVEDRILFSMPHPGGLISFPYVLPVGTGIILMVNDSEEYRLDVLSGN